MDVRLKRAYEAAAPDDGYRVLVDRLWPRGVTKEQAAVDAWEKELAPSTKLRQWFGHEPDRFAEFRRLYIEELRGKAARLTDLQRRARAGTLTLVYSAHDSERNDAVVLAEVLRRGPAKQAKGSKAPAGNNGRRERVFEDDVERRALLLRMGTGPAAWAYLDTLARAARMSRQAIRPLLQTLEREGLVTSSEAPVGLRYRLTDAGRRLRAG